MAAMQAGKHSKQIAPPHSERLTKAGAAATSRRYRWLDSLFVGPLVLAMIVVVGCVLAYRQPTQLTVPVGLARSWPFVAGFHAAEHDEATGRRWRWTTQAAAIGAPFAGPVSSLMLRVHGEDAGPPLTLYPAGSPPLTLTLRTGWQTLWLPVLDRRNNWDKQGIPIVRLETTALPRGDDTRPLGIAIGDAILMVGAGPPPVLLVILLLTTLLLTGLLFEKLRLPGSWVMACVLALAAVLALNSAAYRLYLTAYVWRWLALVLLCWLAYAAAAWGLPRLWHALKVTVSPQQTRALIGLMLLLFVMRYSALSYPLTYSSDLYGHVKRANLAADGQILRLFLPEPDRAPVQWGVSVAVPYSPFYYYVTGLLVLVLPLFPPILILDAFSSLVEASTPLVLAVLLLRAGLGIRTAFWAGALFGFLPFGYVAAVAWALFPTMLGQWLALVALALTACWYPNPPTRPILRWQIAIMTLAFVSYLTALTFLGTAWATLLVISLVWQRRAVRPILISGVAASLLALLLYYGWQVPALVTQALPKLQGQSSGGDAGVGGLARGLVEPLAFAEVLWEQVQLWYPWMLLVPAGLGTALLTLRPQRRLVLMLVVAWLSVYPPFMLLDRVLPLLNKPQLHLLPALALLAGIGVTELARRGRAGSLVPLSLALLLFWQTALEALHIILEMYGKQKF